MKFIFYKGIYLVSVILYTITTKYYIFFLFNSFFLLSNDTLAKHAMPPLKTNKEGRKKKQKVKTCDH